MEAVRLRGFPGKAEQLDSENISPCPAIPRFVETIGMELNFLRDSNLQEQGGSSHSISKKVSWMRLQRCPWTSTLKSGIDEHGILERAPGSQTYMGLVLDLPFSLIVGH